MDNMPNIHIIMALPLHSIASILGGAIVPKLQGILADHIGLQPSFFLPALCYIYITVFGFMAVKRPPARDTLIPAEPV